MNEALIIAKGDSVSIQHYQISVVTKATVFAIADVDVNGKLTLHGPFELSKEYGNNRARKLIDWQAEMSERQIKKA